MPVKSLEPVLVKTMSNRKRPRVSRTSGLVHGKVFFSHMVFSAWMVFSERMVFSIEEHSFMYTRDKSDLFSNGYYMEQLLFQESYFKPMSEFPKAI